MNKMALILITVTALLTACSSNQADKNTEVEENQQSTQTEVVQKDNQEVKQKDKEPAKEDTNHDQWSSLPEYDTIMQNIELKDVTFRKVTDNEGKRILLLSDENGREKYKSIFIKNTNYLKIINIDGEGQIFYGVLK